VLGDRRVDDAVRAELLQQALRDLVGALIFGDLLAHHEHIAVAPHLLRHGVAQGFAHRHGDHLGALGHIRLGLRLDHGRSCGLCGGCGGLLFGLGLRRRRGFSSLLLCGRSARLDIRSALAVVQDHGDRGVHRHIGGAFRHQDLAERAFVDRLDLHGGLVGLDLGDHVAGFHLVALGLHPFGKVALLHGGRKRGHQYVDRHCLCLYFAKR
jgi:hypothetical protein